MAAAKVLTFSAKQQANSDGEGSDYTFTGFELPTGEVLVPSEGYPDAIWATRSAVEPFGDDEIAGCEETGRTVEFSDEEIARAVLAAAQAFGRDSVPESLRALVVEVE